MPKTKEQKKEESDIRKTAQTIREFFRYVDSISVYFNVEWKFLSKEDKMRWVVDLAFPYAQKRKEDVIKSINDTKFDLQKYSKCTKINDLIEVCKQRFDFGEDFYNHEGFIKHITKFEILKYVEKGLK